MVVQLSNDRIQLRLVPEYGARVTSLIDKRSDRQWLIQGELSGATGVEAVYGAAEACGWDECFPTIGVCRLAAWDGSLRDHGELWGRSWVVARTDATAIETSFATPRFIFTRTLTLFDPAVIVDYAVTNCSAEVFPYLWSQHCLLATNSDDQICLSGIDDFKANGRTFNWPAYDGRDLSKVGEVNDGFALKSYGRTPQSASAEIANANGGIKFAWDNVTAFGLWLSYGGWPSTNPVHQIALEPTTSPVDDLESAEATGLARHIAPHETHHWSVHITLTDPGERVFQ